ncbi:MAG: MATE family efflux transporter [Bryobacteraceae bacterium]|nr:MATE family efflux transporter [Bryobacteraceae bacterium]
MDANTTAVSPPRSLWKDIRSAITGTHYDFTKGTLDRSILLLSIPMVLEMAMESLFGLVDVIFVAQLGQQAAAAVGMTESLITLIFAVALGLSMATTAVVSRRIGEKDPDAAAHAAVQSIILGIGISVIVGAAGIVFGPSLLQMMGASEALVSVGSGYTRVLLGGSVTVFLLFLINAIFRGAGDAAIAMRVLWLGNLINIILDPCLIFGLGPFPALGVTGAAVATTTGRGVAVLFQFWELSRHSSRVAIRREHIRIDWPLMRHILGIAAGGMFQYLVATASWVGLWRLMSGFGDAALAGYTIAIRILVFTILPSWGMSNAAATLVGQNLGAKQPDRAESAVWRTGFYNMIFMSVVSVFFITIPHHIAGLITSDPEVQNYAARCLRYLGFGYPFYAWGMIVVQAFNGAGDTRTPMIINITCYWLLQIPLASLLAFTVGMAADGIYLAIAISEVSLAILGVFAFRRGTWKLRQV